MDNSFRTYMARKITLQREQFGLVLPPPPTSSDGGVGGISGGNGPPAQVVAKAHDNDGIKSTKKHTEEENTPGPPRRRRNKKIRFNLDNDFDSPAKQNNKQTSMQNMDGVLKRLKKKHKKGDFKSRKRKRRGSSAFSSLSSVGFDDDSQSEHEASQNCLDDSLNQALASSPVTNQSEDRFECETGNDYQDENQSDKLSSSSTLSSEKQQSPSQTSSASTQLVSIDQLKRQRKDLFFLGVTVLVNGYTDPSSDTIMRLLHKYGGSLEKYETTCVTHIVAESLSTAKAKIYRKQKKPIPVVRPEWIVDCVEAGRLLPFADYLLDQVTEEHVCASVKSFFRQKVEEEFVMELSAGDDSKIAPAFHECDQEEEIIDLDGDCIGVAHDRNLDDAKGLAEDTGFALHQEQNMENVSVCVVDDASEETSAKVETSHLHGTTTVCPSGPSESKPPPTHQIQPDMNPKVSTLNRLKTSKLQNSDAHESNIHRSMTTQVEPPANIPSKEKDASVASGPSRGLLSPSKRPHLHKTVGTDPNFLDTYFSESRLSFIGRHSHRTGHSRAYQRESAHGSNSKRFVLHIDMDCFFAAIAIRNFPQFRDKPVAVGHAWKNDPNGIGGDPCHISGREEMTKSRSELSTCNYLARKQGVKKGMFLHRAKQLCPDLVVLPYDFEGYEDASNKVGEILISVVDEYNGALEQVSCDESYLEFYLNNEETSDTGGHSFQAVGTNGLAKTIADSIRRAIMDETECTASIGVGPNKLLAKLATNHAKAKGGDSVAVASDWKIFLDGVHLREIPGIGYRMEKKLQAHNLIYVQDIWNICESDLIAILGPGLGSKIHKYCHGEDDRLVKPAERKTIGAECNYGVRFDGPYGVDHMIKGLAMEVEKRMNNLQVLGKHITLKVKERKVGAGEPGKFNGHGACNDHSKSSVLPCQYPTRDANIIAREAMVLHEKLSIDKNEIRGIGIIISKLCSECDIDNNSLKPNNMVSWLKSTSPCSKSQNDREDTKENVEHVIGEEEPDSIILNAHLGDTLDVRCNDNFNAAVNCNLNLKEGASKRQGLVKTIKARSSLPTRVHTGELKSFFKLAEIKNGETKLSYDGEQVSLTQLDALPLEIQLQVANGNDASFPNVCGRSYTSRHAENSYEERNEMTNRYLMPKDAKLSRSDDICEINNTFKTLMEGTSSQNSIPTEDEDSANDITVLREWMENHKDPDDVTLVKDFLQICVVEKRLDDVVSFLRLIKIRQDAWNSEHYADLLEATEQSILSVYGAKLDLPGLDLL